MTEDDPAGYSMSSELHRRLSALVAKAAEDPEIRAGVGSEYVSDSLLIRLAMQEEESFLELTVSQIRKIDHARNGLKYYETWRRGPASPVRALNRATGQAVITILALLGIGPGISRLAVFFYHDFGVTWSIIIPGFVGLCALILETSLVLRLVRRAGLQESLSVSRVSAAVLLVAGFIATLYTFATNASSIIRPPAFPTSLIPPGFAISGWVLVWIYLRLALRASNFPGIPYRLYIDSNRRKTLRRLGAASLWEVTVAALLGTLADFLVISSGRESPRAQAEYRALQAKLNETYAEWADVVYARAIIPFLRSKLHEHRYPDSPSSGSGERLTPRDVENQTFTTTRLWSGYDESEVDNFLDKVRGEIGRLIEENEELRAKMAEILRGSSKLSGPISPRRAAESMMAKSAFGDPLTMGDARLDQNQFVTPELVQISSWPRRDSPVEEEVRHSDGVIRRFDFGAGDLVLVDQVPGSDTVNWTTEVSVRSFLRICREFLQGRENVEAQVSINGRLAEMEGAVLLELAGTASEELNESCQFLRVDAEDSSLAFQVLPKVASPPARFIGISAERLDMPLLLSMMLRTASPLIVQNTLGFGSDSFINRITTLLSAPPLREQPE